MEERYMFFRANNQKENQRTSQWSWILKKKIIIQNGYILSIFIMYCHQ